MLKALVVCGLLMTFGAAAHAEELFVTKESLFLRHGTANTLILRSAEAKTECLLKHGEIAADVFLGKSNGISILSTEQAVFKISVQERAREIIESLGGKYEAHRKDGKAKTNFELADEVKSLGGRLSFYNDTAISDFRRVTNFNLQPLASNTKLVLSCRSVGEQSVESLLALLGTNSVLDILVIENKLETAAENSL